ncbi:MAG: dockerin type I domain-containing protein, partial [Phycisphaerales bacterium]|nr:dockerin type I domain-containing protein [Phycisphaerales bacterium]
MLLLRRFTSATLALLAIGALFVGCKAKDTTASMGQTISIEDTETIPEGYNRSSQREKDLNIAIRFPKGERGSKDPSSGMKIENRIGDDVDFRDDTEEDVFEMLPADVNGDYSVNILDLLAVINQYANTCPSSPEECPTDIDNDTRTGVTDLVLVISSWGESIEPPEVQGEPG